MNFNFFLLFSFFSAFLFHLITINGGVASPDEPAGRIGRSIAGVGMALYVPGVDPNRKYRYPQTSNQAVGWKARESLEFFGVNRYGKRGFDMSKLYG